MMNTEENKLFDPNVSAPATAPSRVRRTLIALTVAGASLYGALVVPVTAAPLASHQPPGLSVAEDSTVTLAIIRRRY